LTGRCIRDRKARSWGAFAIAVRVFRAVGVRIQSELVGLFMEDFRSFGIVQGLTT